jgi:uncharacterized protein (TIGR03437 family)
LRYSTSFTAQLEGTQFGQDGLNVQTGSAHCFAQVTEAGGAASWTGNFPTSLGGTSVMIGGKAAYLSFVSPGQIDLPVPNLRDWRGAGIGWQGV